jgi:PLP dependent protein
MVEKDRITANLTSLKNRVEEASNRAGRDPNEAKLVAVTKTVGMKEVRTLNDLGQLDFGENRPMEAAEKVETLAGLGLRWHMIGHLQRNKVRKVLGAYSLIHSVDSIRLLEEIERAAEADADVLLQVNVSGEESKFGVEPEELPDLLARAREMQRVRVMGLMTMAPLVGNAEETRPMFRRLRELRDLHAADAHPRTPLVELSMGMTQDFEIAIEEGATLVRVGSALFK